MYCLVYMHVFISEWKRSVVHTWIYLTKKNSSIRSVYIFDGLCYRQSRGSACKQLGEKSSLITILFSSTSLYYFENSARLKSLWANKSSIRQGENRPKEPKSCSTIGISPKLYTAAEINSEINHDLVCAVIEVSAVYRSCYKVKPNLTVLKSCMMLSGSSIMVLCFGRDL